MASFVSATARRRRPMRPPGGRTENITTPPRVLAVNAGSTPARIANAVQNNRVTMIYGGTGTGKSTQVPQILLDRLQGAFISGDTVLCTQPRRLAVAAAAMRVAEERGCTVGSEVGYHIGQQNVSTPQSRLVFVTCGILLEQLRTNGLGGLKRYKVVIMDEVHERSVESDLVLSCVCAFLKKQRDLRLVLMSATADFQRYKQFFGNLVTNMGTGIQLVTIPNTINDNAEVTECYLREACCILKGQTSDKTYMKSITRVRKICKKATPTPFPAELGNLVADMAAYIHSWGPYDVSAECRDSILIFLPTYRTLEMVHAILVKYNDEFFSSQALPCGFHRQGTRGGHNYPVGPIHLFALHGSIDIDTAVSAMLEESLPGSRKIILATNIAETSVTIPDVSYIIDACRTNVINWDARVKKTSASIAWASKSQLRQRRGRAGRTRRRSFIVRLVPRTTYDTFSDFEPPDVLRKSLREETLLLACSEHKLMKNPHLVFQRCLDPPEENRINEAIKDLIKIKALKQQSSTSHRTKSNLPVPTRFGRLLAALPMNLDPGRFVLSAAQSGNLLESALLGAILSNSPAPIVRRFGATAEYRGAICRFLGEAEVAAGFQNDIVRDEAQVLLANMCAYFNWFIQFADVVSRWKTFHGITEAAATRKHGSSTASSFENKIRDLGKDCSAGRIVGVFLSDTLPSAVRAVTNALYTILEVLECHHVSIASLRDVPLCRSKITNACVGSLVNSRGSLMVTLDNILLPHTASLLRKALSARTHWDDSTHLNRSPVANDVCTYFWRGDCTSGYRCHKLHTREHGPPPCPFGRTCNYGSSCVYYHENTNADNTSIPAASDVEFDSSNPSRFLTDDIGRSDVILLLGEGNFSFAKSLYTGFVDSLVASTSMNSLRIIPTAFNTKAQIQSFCGDKTTIPTLYDLAEASHITETPAGRRKVLLEDPIFSLDSTRLHFLHYNEEEFMFDGADSVSIVWNFPLVDQDGKDTSGETLMDAFFSSVGCLFLWRSLVAGKMCASVRIALSLSSNQFSRWKVERCANRHSFYIQRSYPLDFDEFPEYTPVRNNSDAALPCPNSRVHIFQFSIPSSQRNLDVWFRGNSVPLLMSLGGLVHRFPSIFNTQNTVFEHRMRNGIWQACGGLRWGGDTRDNTGSVNGGGATSGNENLCSICFDNLDTIDVPVMLQCAHSFCQKCIEPWLRENSTCPVCRTEIPPGQPRYLPTARHSTSKVTGQHVIRLERLHRAERDYISRTSSPFLKALNTFSKAGYLQNVDVAYIKHRLRIV